MGLSSAHRIGVVHRDIKPQNILFDQYGNPRISDFGIAHLPVEQGGINEDDGWSSVAGTPNYMAPEQMVPGGEIDGRADLYAVGIMAYEMLTGERPYRAGSATSLYELRDVVDNSPMPTASDFPPQISAKTRSLVLRMMQRQARKRFDTADSVIAAIDDAVSELGNVGEAQNISRERVSVRLEMFEDILRMFLVDGVVSPPERRELIKRAQRLGIAERVAKKSEEKVRQEMELPSMKDLQKYESLATELIGDRDYSEDDRVALRSLGDSLGISVDQQRRIDDAVMVRFRMKLAESDDAGLI
jgi:serine/threonine protein kinase